jgi:ethanolamine permease
MVVGMLALISGKTSEIITISVFGALTLYIIAMASVLRLRQTQPLLPRPFLTPGYPYLPWMALVIAIISFFAMCVYNFKLSVIYCSILLVSYFLFKLFKTSNRL